MLPLKTPRLLLRDFTAVDFEAFYATTENPEYRRYYPENELSPSHLKDIFERILASTSTQPRIKFPLAICLRNAEAIEELSPIGTCGVRIEAEGGLALSFGCAIARPHWGKGYAFEASCALIDYGFSNLPIERIFAETIAENSRARTLAERLGMHLEGQPSRVKFFRGREWDVVTYAITKNEWRGF